jgi:transcriptional regulator with XRE-family HTH domain
MNMTQFHELLIKNMKLHRKMRGYSQMKLAELCAVSPNYIGEIEMGRKFPSADTMERIVAALEIKPYQLFIDDNDAPGSVEEALTLYSEQLKDSLHGYVEEALKSYIKQPIRYNNLKEKR